MTTQEQEAVKDLGAPELQALIKRLGKFMTSGATFERETGLDRQSADALRVAAAQRLRQLEGRGIPTREAQKAAIAKAVEDARDDRAKAKEAKRRANLTVEERQAEDRAAQEEYARRAPKFKSEYMSGDDNEGDE